MAAITDEKLITGEELLHMPNVGPCELVAGRIVPIPFREAIDGYYLANFGFLLWQFLKINDLGKAGIGHTGIYTQYNPDTVRGADLFYISHERNAQQASGDGYLMVAPELVIDFLSPRNPPETMAQKLTEYFDIGVQLVWIVDPKQQIVTAYRSVTEARHFTTQDDLPGDEVLPGLVIPVAQIFED